MDNEAEIEQFLNKQLDSQKIIDPKRRQQAKAQYMAGLRKFEQAAENERTKLNYVVGKIRQAYRIRLQLLIKRHELLEFIDRDFANIRRNTSFYTPLKNTLDRERKVLSIIESESHSIGNRMNYALAQLEGAKAELSKHVKSSHVRKLERLLVDIIEFIRLMQHDVSNIKARMDKESVLLINRDSKHFDEFILAWDDELNGNDNLIKHYGDMLQRHKKIFYEIKRGYEYSPMILDMKFLGIIFGAPALIKFLGSPTDEGFSTILAIVTGVIMAGSVLILDFFAIYRDMSGRSKLIGTDKRIIRHLEDMRGIKKGLIRKLLRR